MSALATEAEVERCDWRDFIEATSDTPADVTAALDAHFTRYAKGRCPGCGSDLGGIFGTFTWGLAHGEGHCGKCSWPATGHHFIRPIEGGEIALRGFVLPYHPSVFERRDIDGESD